MLIRRRPWLAAIIASAATHALLLWVVGLGLRGSETAEGHPPPSGVTLGGGRPPFPIALVEGPAGGERLNAEPPSNPLAARNNARPRRARAAASEATAVPAGEGTQRDTAATAYSSLVRAGPPSTETGATSAGFAPGPSEPVGGTGEISDGHSASTGGSGSLGGQQATSEGIAELHQRLASSARRCYPHTARRLRLRGEVGLHFCLSERGLSEATALHGSTGSALLDRAAVECVLAGALPAPGIPGCYDVQIRFADDP